MNKKIKKVIRIICLSVFCLTVIIIAVNRCYDAIMDRKAVRLQKELLEQREETYTKETEYISKDIYEEITDNKNDIKNDINNGMEESIGDDAGITENTEHQDSNAENGIIPDILSEYKSLYDRNQDMTGWLCIPGTDINYPVMQTVDDENYYLTRDFDKNYNKNGCLIMDADSVTGTGTKSSNYQDGTKPSDNLIIHGHTMQVSGLMFGRLSLYEDEEYGWEHRIIKFDSLYEHREYELIAVFYSQVYYEQQEVFKYYQFFEAENEEEFSCWYENIKELSLYDTGVTAEYGDEFITLSCCAYHVEDGRFAVIGKRVR